MILAANLFIAAAFLLGAALLIVDIRKKKRLYQKEKPLITTQNPKENHMFYTENHMFYNVREAVQYFVTKAALRAVGLGHTFTAQQLEQFVYDNTNPNTHSSTTILRALRELRNLNKLNYVVLNRGKQLYDAVPVNSLEGFGDPARQD
jgi:hypothetical protein